LTINNSRHVVVVVVDDDDDDDAVQPVKNETWFKWEI
jgi:hypothetical protein